MSHDPLSDVVSRQYRRWVYPEPIHDLPAWLAHNWQWLDPSHSHRIFWPDREYRPDIDILVAGCGANQGAVLAYTNPDAKVVAIDVSDTSLEHHRHLQRRYGLDNLELHLLPIEQVGSLGREFDLIVSTGVLHHLVDPGAGMKALASCLRLDGVIAVMLYARYGRIGVELMQSVFRDLGLTQDEQSLDIVREAIAMLPPDHPVHSYLAIAPDLHFDAGLVDTFLHGRDRSYTVADCLALVSSANLAFQEWFLKSPYYPPLDSDSAFLTSIAEQPEPERWSLMERVNTSNGCHYFLACRTDRSVDSYHLDWGSAAAMQYIPSLRHACHVDGQTVRRHDWGLPLESTDAALVRLADGRRSIEDIVQQARELGIMQATAEAHDDVAGLTLFRRLWQRDFIQIALARNDNAVHGGRTDQPRPRLGR